MQHLGVNIRGIWRFELGFLSGFRGFFLLKKCGLIFKSPVATLPPIPHRAYANHHVVSGHSMLCMKQRLMLFYDYECWGLVTLQVTGNASCYPRVFKQSRQFSTASIPNSVTYFHFRIIPTGHILSHFCFILHSGVTYYTHLNVNNNFNELSYILLLP